MNAFPSPPASPLLTADKVMCGSCDKTLSSDWFCSDCHTKCSTCNRFLSQGDHCTRCWSFDQHTHRLVRKEQFQCDQYHLRMSMVYQQYLYHHQQQQQQQQQQRNLSKDSIKHFC